MYLGVHDSLSTALEARRIAEEESRDATAKICGVCGKKFSGYNSRMFCSDDCWRKDYARRNPNRAKKYADKYLGAVKLAKELGLI